MLKKEKKAQLKIQQMAFMLMALTLFFVLIGLFFIVTKLSGLKESVTNLEKENAQKLIMKLASSPEFSCENAFRFGEIDCVDFDKVMVLNDGKIVEQGAPRELLKDTNSQFYKIYTLKQ